jgi:hypothetical protein
VKWPCSEERLGDDFPLTFRPWWPPSNTTNAWPGSRFFVQISTLPTTTPTYPTLTVVLDMPGAAGHATRVSSIDHQPRVVGPSNERGTRGHANELPHIAIICKSDVPSAGRSTPSGPDIDKDLPRIPSTSTGLWGTEPATVSSEMMASLVAAPTPSPLSYPTSQNLRRIPTTEAQRIAAQYRRRYGSLEALKSEVFYPNDLRVSSFLISLPFSLPIYFVITSATCGRGLHEFSGRTAPGHL